MGFPNAKRYNPGRVGLGGDCGAAHDGHTRMDRAAVVVGEVDRMRVYGPGRLVSEGQAAELAGMGTPALVTAGASVGIAHTLSEQNPAAGDYYQSGWGELHRRCNVTTLTGGCRPSSLGR
jgi:hypothetical protein